MLFLSCIHESTTSSSLTPKRYEALASLERDMSKFSDIKNAVHVLATQYITADVLCHRLLSQLIKNTRFPSFSRRIHPLTPPNRSEITILFKLLQAQEHLSNFNFKDSVFVCYQVGGVVLHSSSYCLSRPTEICKTGHKAFSFHCFLHIKYLASLQVKLNVVSSKVGPKILQFMHGFAVFIPLYFPKLGTMRLLLHV